MSGERKCEWCGLNFSHGTAARTLCSNRCKKAAYYSRHKEKIDQKQLARNKTKAARDAFSKYRRSEKGRATQRLSHRRRAAKSALAAILLPTHNMPEVNQ